MNQQQENYEYQEIDSRRIIGLLLDKFWLIATVVILCSLIVFIISSAMPKIYEVKEVLEVGTVIAQDKLIAVDVPDTIKKKIDRDFYGMAVRRNLSISERKYPKIKSDNSTGNYLFLTIRSSDVERAKSILTELGRQMINDYQSQIDISIRSSKNSIEAKIEEIARVDNKIKSLENEIKTIEAQAAALQGIDLYKQEPGTQFAIAVKKEGIEAKKQEIEDLYLKNVKINSDIGVLKSLMEQIKATEVVQAAGASEDPVSPRRATNSLIGALMGFIAAILFILGREWWKNKI